MEAAVWSILAFASAVTHAAVSVGHVSPLNMLPATTDQEVIVRQLLGGDFADGNDGAFPPDLRVAQPDINGDGIPDLVVSQRAHCSNHTCTDEVFLKTQLGWRHLTSLENWGAIYLVKSRTNAMKRIVIFEHLSDDCLACSDPDPVWVNWHPESFTASGERGAYVEGEALTKTERQILARPPVTQ